jgi:hypothetical protein
MKSKGPWAGSVNRALISQGPTGVSSEGFASILAKDEEIGHWTLAWMRLSVCVCELVCASVGYAYFTHPNSILRIYICTILFMYLYIFMYYLYLIIY